jgi:hypothetical protein
VNGGSRRSALGARQRRSALIAGVAIIAAGVAPRAAHAADPGMCDPPAMDTAGWQYMRTVGIAVKVPSSFQRIEIDPTSVTYGSGVRRVSIFFGDGQVPNVDAGTTELGSCSTRIGGRPVTITLFKYAPTKSAPYVFEAVARWDSTAGLPAVAALILATDAVTLDRLKVVFYTAEVGGAKAAIACVTEDPPPTAETVVDSAAVALRARESPGGFPPGSALLLLRFSTAGTLASVGVLAGDLPDATKRQLALIVGTNVRDRAPGAAVSVQLRVNSTRAGLAYEVTESLVCRP